MEVACPWEGSALASDDLSKMGDDQLTQAYYEWKESGSMLPIIKHELRYKIQNRRLSEGQGELKITFENPRPYELTAEEKMRRDRRRFNNRISAMKCRNKKKLELSTTNQELNQLMEHNKTLRTKYECLKREKKAITYKLTQILSAYNSVKTTITVEQNAFPLALDLFNDVS